jgi:hypothetical protein
MALTGEVKTNREERITQDKANLVIFKAWDFIFASSLSKP